MMGSMQIETCWAFNKFWNNKFYYMVASCWLFLLIRHAEIYKDLPECNGRSPRVDYKVVVTRSSRRKLSLSEKSSVSVKAVPHSTVNRLQATATILAAPTQSQSWNHFNSVTKTDPPLSPDVPKFILLRSPQVLRQSVSAYTDGMWSTVKRPFSYSGSLTL